MNQCLTTAIVMLMMAFSTLAWGESIWVEAEIHHTPKHGSWLNVAEIELIVVGRRLPDRVSGVEELERHLAAIECERNESARGIDWQFSTEQARIKLKRLYPSLEVR